MATAELTESELPANQASPTTSRPTSPLPAGQPVLAPVSFGYGHASHPLDGQQLAGFNTSQVPTARSLPTATQQTRQGTRPSSTRRRASSPNQRVVRKKRKKQASSSGGRGASFTETELESFLEVLLQHLPVGGEEWDAVARVHKSRYPDENRSTDSLRRKFALLYRKNVPTGDPRIPRTVLLAKKIRDEMTERVDLGERAEEEIGGLLSDADGDLDSGDEGTGTVDMDMRAGAESNHTLSPSPTFPIVHKRSRRDRGDTGDSVLDLFKASMLQDREFRSEERERAAKERADERERRREDERLRAEMREEERKERERDRQEARLQREEDRKGREAYMQMMMMLFTKGQGNGSSS